MAKPKQLPARTPAERVKAIVRAVVPRGARNWLRSPAKSGRWVWNCALFSLGTTKIAPLLPDWGLRCHPHAYGILVRDQIRDPEQRAEFIAFVSRCSSATFLFDAGAHFGVFSLAAAHFGGRAIAIDPSPTATRMIARHAALNGLAGRIQIVQAAVSEASGTLDMLGSGPFSDGYFRVASGRGRRDMSEMAATTIDELSARFGEPSHVKIDVEGHEAAAIRGGRLTFTGHSPVLFLEIHNQKIAEEGGEPGSVIDELDRLRYAVFSLDGNELDRASVAAKPLVRVIARRRP